MIEILDTTLRDGEQTAGVSFTDKEKLAIAKLLLQTLKVNRLEVASARVSSGELKAFASICQWAAEEGFGDKIEALGFVDESKSVDWIYESGGRVINLLSKGSLNHLSGQLKKTPVQHRDDILRVVEKADSKGMTVNLYMEDWSNGMKDSPDYVYYMLEQLKDTPIRRFLIPDTLGMLNPYNTYEYCSEVVKAYPQLHFDFHAHNDYGLAVANTMAAVKAGVKGVHVTVNGLGERSGNAPLAAVLGMLNDQLQVENTLDEKELLHVCRYVSTISGIRIPQNEPIIGDAVFTQSAGVHADGDCKGGLYQNKLLPERFGRERKYALGKTSGKANIIKNIDKIGISLSPEQIKLVTDRVVELGDKKEMVTVDDLPFIISDVLKGEFAVGKDNIKIINYSLQLTRNMRPVATIRLSIDDVEYEEVSSGSGQYDAFMKAVWKVYDKLGKAHPVLRDYAVSIPPGGKTDALVQTKITWDWNGKELRTRGLDADQTESAIKATIKMLNLIEDTKEN